MADRESAERAVKEANPIIDGRKANVNLAYLGAKPRTNIQNGKTCHTYLLYYLRLFPLIAKYLFAICPLKQYVKYI